MCNNELVPFATLSLGGEYGKTNLPIYLYIEI